MDASEVKQNHEETLHLVHFQAAGQLRGTHHIPRWGGFLSLSELEEIVLDVEVCKNNRPQSEERDLKKRLRFRCTTKNGHGTAVPESI